MARQHDTKLTRKKNVVGGKQVTKKTVKNKTWQSFHKSSKKLFRNMSKFLSWKSDKKKE